MEIFIFVPVKLTPVKSHWPNKTGNLSRAFLANFKAMRLNSA